MYLLTYYFTGYGSSDSEEYEYLFPYDITIYCLSPGKASLFQFDTIILSITSEIMLSSLQCAPTSALAWWVTAALPIIISYLRHFT